MPVYIPAKLYRFILAAGYKPKFYDVPTDLNINLNEIKGLIDDQTQAVFAVHFFGVPVDLQPLQIITKQAGVYLIEDCAHTLHSSYKGKLLGTTGDFTLFSTRKMMQLHCGGVLVLNTKPWDFKPSRNERVWSPFTMYHYAGSRIKYTVNNLLKSYSPFKQSEIPYNGYIDLSVEHVVRVKKMDFFFRWYNNIPDLDKMADRRRKKFQFILNGINDLESFYPVGMKRYAMKKKTGKYSLIKGFVPFSMPILTPPDTRDQIQQAICDAGVLCFVGWPEAPFGLNGFKGADILKDRLLELPVHQFMNSHHLSNVVDCLNSLPKYV
ncbi:MAG: DegT/DnrJ/EryC1/StrS family aminotransferase [Balneolaceae bacterium]